MIRLVKMFIWNYCIVIFICNHPGLSQILDTGGVLEFSLSYKLPGSYPLSLYFKLYIPPVACPHHPYNKNPINKGTNILVFKFGVWIFIQPFLYRVADGLHHNFLLFGTGPFVLTKPNLVRIYLEYIMELEVMVCEFCQQTYEYILFFVHRFHWIQDLFFIVQYRIWDAYVKNLSVDP